MWLRLKSNAVVLWRTYLRWQDDDGPLLSGAVAYYLGLSLFPMLLLVIAGLGFFFRHTTEGQDAEQQVLKLVAEQVSPTLERHIRDMLAQVRDRSSTNSQLGLIGLLIAAIAGFTQMQRAIDHIWGLPPSEDKGIVAGLRHTVIERGIAFLMLLGVGVLIIVVFIASVVIAGLDGYFTDHFGSRVLPGPTLRLLVSIALNTALFTLMYRVLPPIRVLWRDAVRAGLFAACGWEMGRVVLASFVIGTRYTSAYGIVGSFLAVLLWCYYAVSIILMGAEYLKETSAHDQAARKSTATETPEVVTPHAKPELLHSADDVPPGGEIPRAPPAADVRSR